MKRIFLPLIVVAIVGLVAATVVVLTKRPAGQPTGTANTRTGTSDTTANNANLRTIVSTVEKGDTEVGKSVSYRGVTFEVTTAAVLDAYHGQTAPQDKEYIVLFTKPLPGNPDLSSWLTRETTLIDQAGTRYPVKQTQVITAGGEVDAGYFWFTVNDGASGFSLSFEGDEGKASVDLGF